MSSQTHFLVQYPLEHLGSAAEGAADWGLDASCGLGGGNGRPSGNRLRLLCDSKEFVKIAVFLHLLTKWRIEGLRIVKELAVISKKMINFADGRQELSSIDD